MDVPKTAEIMKLFDSFNREDLAGGYAVAITEGQQPIFKKAYGFANHEYESPFTTHTIFDFASVAKQFTGYSIATLLEDEQLSPDEDIRTYLPEIPDYGKPIFIRHLLGHTSGLRDWFPLVKLAGRSMNDTITDDYLMKLICRQQALNFAPGEQFAYSNSGYFLLAQIIQRATGKSLRTFAQEKIFGPLGMGNTFFADQEGEIIPNRAAAYVRDAHNIYRQANNRLLSYGSSSLFSSIEDMVKWVQHLDDQWTGQNPILNRMLTPTLLNNGKQLQYNFGITKGNWRGHTFFAHGGSWSGFACDVSYFPESRKGIIFITNRTPNFVNTHHAVREILLDEPHLEEHPPQNSQTEKASPAPPKAETQELIGEYFNNEIQTAYTIELKNGQLTATHLVNADVTLTWVEPGKYLGNRDWFTEASFTRDSAGKIDGFLVSADAGNLAKNLWFKRY